MLHDSDLWVPVSRSRGRGGGLLRCHPQLSELSLASKPLLRELSGKESRLKENGSEGTVGVRES